MLLLSGCSDITPDVCSIIKYSDSYSNVKMDNDYCVITIHNGNNDYLLECSNFIQKLNIKLKTNNTDIEVANIPAGCKLHKGK